MVASVPAERPGAPAVTDHAEPPVRTSLRVAWLAGLTYVVAAATHPGAHGRHLAATVLTATTTLAWATWLTARHRRSAAWSVVGIVGLAGSGGGLVVLHPIGVAVVGVAGMCAASLFEIVPAAIATLPGLIGAAVAVGVTGHAAGVIGGAASGAAAGLVVGMGRRQGQERIRQDAELALAHERGALADERAEVLAERNRLAREVHDVLAHTLSALAIQTEAMVAVAEEAGSADEMHAIAVRARRLVTEGLQETRRAVRVLRDEPVDPSEQIQALAAEDGAEFTLVGTPRTLPPAAGLALIRVAQEALTNARKHAGPAPAAVSLTVTDVAVELVVDTASSTGPSSPLATTGSGLGLQGMRERLELVGGSLSAGPHDDGWRVHAVVTA